MASHAATAATGFHLTGERVDAPVSALSRFHSTFPTTCAIPFPFAIVAARFEPRLAEQTKTPGSCSAAFSIDGRSERCNG